MGLKVTGHFSGIGWITPRDEYEIQWFPERRLEALRLESNEYKLIYQVKNGKGITKCQNGQIAGTVGKSSPIYAVSIALEDSQDHVVYRVWLKNIGWTAFGRDGEWSGSQLESGDCYIAGIQVFCIERDDTKTMYITAEATLRDYCRTKDGLFIENPEKMLLAATHSYLTYSEKEVEHVENGYILPLMKKGDSLDGIYAGGVVDAEGNFVAGHERCWTKRYNYGCIESYPIEKEENIATMDETVIFGGVIIRFFGHLMTECLSRLWYALEHTEEKIIFLTIPGQEVFANDFFQILGIDKRIVVVTAITKFSKIIVPAQTIRLWSDYTYRYIYVYDKIRANVQPAQYEKIYLSRTAYRPQDGVNERFFEDFYKRREYEIIYPEKHSIREQVEILAGAKEVVCTEGTLSHLALFCAPHTKLIIIRRTQDNILLPQLIVNQARQLDVTYVDATFNFMPTKHSGGTFLYGPTHHFIQYLKRNEISYTEDEIKFDISQYCHDYLKLWLSRVNNLRLFNMVNECDIYDIVSMMNSVFGLPQISREKYVTKGKKDEKMYKQEIERLKKENKELKERVKLLMES